MNKIQIILITIWGTISVIHALSDLATDKPLRKKFFYDGEFIILTILAPIILIWEIVENWIDENKRWRKFHEETPFSERHKSKWAKQMEEINKSKTDK